LPWSTCPIIPMLTDGFFVCGHPALSYTFSRSFLSRTAVRSTSCRGQQIIKDFFEDAFLLSKVR
jgi:hypothetical protein